MNGLELLRIAIHQSLHYLDEKRGEGEMTYIAEIDMQCTPSQLINKDIRPMTIA
jgi:hypothetical protein